jgi:hypothetical protein
VLLRELLEAGYTAPLTLSIKGTITSDLINGLLRQYDVLDAIDALRIEQGKAPLNPPFYACSITLGPGQEVQRGAIQKKAIVPPVALMPTPVDRAYLVEQYVRKEWVSTIERLIDPTIAWSIATSAQIAEVQQDYDEEAYVTRTTVHSDPAGAPIGYSG